MDNYKSIQIETATPERLLLMLYDGAIRFLNVAIQAIEDKQIETTHNNLLKAEAIIIELMSVLNFEVGGEISKNLFSLYDFMYRHLVQANIKKDADMVREVVGLLSDLRKTWAEAAIIAGQMRKDGKLGEQPGPTTGAITFAG
ncbi:MAG: flagellar export chaperone FliS [Candidatus Sericytochromatia bacterium]|nr:flagellar export chaperone FliS [Candidatus Sericytochromatia bacterium]